MTRRTTTHSIGARGSCLAAGVAAVLATGSVSGCASHEDRYGRDPRGLDRPVAKAESGAVETARAQAADPQEQEGDEVLTPVPVLLVNGDAITAEEVLKDIRPELEQLAETREPDSYATALLDLARRAIRNRVDRQLLYQEARRRMTEQELEPVERYVDQRIRDIVNEEYGGRESRYEKYLREKGYSVAEDRERIRREVIVAAHLQRTIGPKVVEPTRREIEAYHEQYLRTLDGARRRHMQLIDIPYGPTDASGEPADRPISLDFARQRMQAAQAELAAGVDFAEVARTHSRGINAAAGGDWGLVAIDGIRARWRPAVEALYGLAEGQTSDIIETDQALFIVHCAGIEQQEVRGFAEMQPELIQSYKNLQYDQLTRELVDELHGKAVVHPENPGRFLLAVMQAAPAPKP